MSVQAMVRNVLPIDFEGNLVRDAWDRLHRIPGGKRLFSRGIGLAVPYTGNIEADVIDLDRGYAKVQMRDTRKVRNHLSSVHAIAQANLAELCGNIAVSYSMPDDARFIVAGFSIEYLAKARGTISAECHCPIPLSNEKHEYEVKVVLTDASGTEVTKTTLRTLIGPKKPVNG